MKGQILTLNNENMSEITDKAAKTLLGGGLVVYPTDTSYGLACDPRQEDALKRLIDVKERDRKLGVPLLFNDKKQCESYHDFGDLESVLTRLFWPGPLTLVVSVKEGVPEHLTGGRGSIAIRVPNHPIPRELAEKIDAPIIGTSANKAGGPSPFSISVAREQLGEEVDLYIDGGHSSSENNSTIVGVEHEGDSANIKIYREGELSIDKITENLRVDSDAARFWTNRLIYADM